LDHFGIDVHKKEGQICIPAEGGELIERRVRTDRRRFAPVLGERPPARILLEASMERRCAERPDTVDELAARATTVDDNPLTLPSPQRGEGF